MQYLLNSFELLLPVPLAKSVPSICIIGSDCALNLECTHISIDFDCGFFSHSEKNSQTHSQTIKGNSVKGL